MAVEQFWECQMGLIGFWTVGDECRCVFTVSHCTILCTEFQNRALGLLRDSPQTTSLTAWTDAEPHDMASSQSEGAGFFQLHEMLEHPVDRAVVVSDGKFVEVPPISLWKAAGSVQVVVTINTARGELLQAFRRWVRGGAFTTLPVHLLDDICIPETLAIPNPWFHLFVGMNLCEHQRFEDGAVYYVASFTDDEMKDEDECCYMNELVEEETGMSLGELHKKSPGRAQSEVARVLKAWHDARHSMLRKIAARETGRKKLAPLDWKNAASVVMADCEVHSLTREMIHMLLFYAEGLCIRHFEQRLFVTEPVGKDSALEYAGVDMDAATANARDPQTVAAIKHTLEPEHARLLRAVCAIAAEAASRDWDEVLEDETLWLASGENAPVRADMMMHAFRSDQAQSAMYDLAERQFLSDLS